MPEPTGIGVFEIEDGSGLWEVGGYFVETPDDTALDLLAAAHGAKSFVISELPETDWVAHVRRELAPVIAGRFFLYGSHDADKVPANVVPLAIDAAMAFGTGHHGTTQGCLIALDRLDNLGVRGANIADIGCGTAVLAMAAARIWPASQVIASDIDEVAVDTAIANLGFNGMEGAFPVVEAAGFDHSTLGERALYDLIFANILKGPLVDMAPDMAHHAAPNAHAVLSGILNEQAEEVLAAYGAVGFSEKARDVLGEWTTLTLQKTA